MKKSESGVLVLTNLYEKLRNAQVELKAPKNQYNSFGKYKYRNAEDIMEAVKPVNLKYGLTLTISDDIVQVGERIYVKATATLSDGTNVITNTAFAREEESKKGMDGSQVTGASSSYARKYALNGLYLIDDTKDADTDENRVESDERAKKRTTHTNKAKDEELPQDEIERLESVKNVIKTLVGMLKEKYKVTPQQVADYMKKVTGKPAKEIDLDTQLQIIKNIVELKDKQNEQ